MNTVGLCRHGGSFLGSLQDRGWFDTQDPAKGIKGANRHVAFTAQVSINGGTWDPGTPDKLADRQAVGTDLGAQLRRNTPHVFTIHTANYTRMDENFINYELTQPSISDKFIHMDENFIKMDIANRVVVAARTAGRSKNWLATETGIPYSTLDRRMRGVDKGFTCAEILRIAQALNVPTRTLLEPLSDL